MPASAIPTASALHRRTASLAAAASGPCEDLLWAMDTELSNMITSCDADSGDWSTLGPIDGITSLACVELDHSGPGGGRRRAGGGSGGSVTRRGRQLIRRRGEHVIRTATAPSTPQ